MAPGHRAKLVFQATIWNYKYKLRFFLVMLLLCNYSCSINFTFIKTVFFPPFWTWHSLTWSFTNQQFSIVNESMTNKVIFPSFWPMTLLIKWLGAVLYKDCFVLECTTNAFCNLPQRNWFRATGFCDQDVDCLHYHMLETFVYYTSSRLD